MRTCLALFSRLSWPYLRLHKLRSALALFSVALGVAVFFAVQSSSEGALDGLARTIQQTAGTARLQVTAGDGGFAEEVLDRVRQAPEVGLAAPVIGEVVEADLPGERGLLVLGVDMTGDFRMRSYAWPATPNWKIPCSSSRSPIRCSFPVGWRTSSVLRKAPSCG